MRYLADTNILLRLVKPDDSDYSLVRTAVNALWSAGHDLCYTSQNLGEFWNVCTRPPDRNGFGLSIAETDSRARLIEEDLIILPDSPQIHFEWRQMVVRHSVSGAQVHDARLVAVMMVHGLSQILTFNASDFVRYSSITALHPSQISI